MQEVVRERMEAWRKVQGGIEAEEKSGAKGFARR